MDRQTAKMLDMLRAGADPRRAAPYRGGPQVVPASPPWRLLIVAAAFGAVLALLVVSTVGLALNVRPARPDDIRIAQLVRSSVPDIDRLSSAELVARLSVPARVGALLTSLTRSHSGNVGGWVAALVQRPRLVVDPGRVAAMNQFISHLADAPIEQRLALLDSTMEIARALQRDSASNVLRVLSQLSSDDLNRLSEDAQLRELLEQIAALSREQRSALLVAGLSSIPQDPERAALLRTLNQLDPPVVRLLLRWQSSADQGSREMLMAILDGLENRDVQLDRLLAAFAANNRALLTLLKGLPSSCNTTTYRACK